ncbi:hypothetical protein SARC_05934 [Sphaeroforma arctica JP610]|uniref:4-alpha-glucanotransferase n=1 Tax=Sphaeroforma arctica JP610 TaxID=667725 RepID=A0A0L0FY54_9EUKA|nr:hypothetical protein SARC_05934 [Sphaeroforma arctica JP610]KNC81765.1 hypothetical protein SARC_05934 [Sphaeroforma arctica JP610]|eukprot:XP_014155667.1 hypothetical protein SARC_05934 [Sphaeroforma arctica JP610]
MTEVTFSIQYNTQPGESIVVTGSIPELGEWEVNKALRLDYRDGGHWLGAATISGDFEYKYAIAYDFGTALTCEFGDNRKCALADGLARAVLQESWRPHEVDTNVLYSSFFVDGALRPAEDRIAPATGKYESGPVVRIVMRCPQVETGDSVAVTGSCAALGDWDEAKALVLSNVDHPVWTGEFNTDAGQEISYKFIIKGKDGKVRCWEEGDNRSLLVSKSFGKGDLWVKSDEFFRFKANWRGCGVAMPVFALRTKESAGVGEFNDIKKLVDWSDKVGCALIQILPINDTVAKQKWTDSYPYAAISVYALHPMYLNMKKMGTLRSETTQKAINEKAKELNALPEVDYEAVMKLKSRFYKLLFDEVKEEFFKDPAYQAWFEKNKEWLLPYAMFSYFRDIYQTPDFTKWGDFSSQTFEQLEVLADPKKDDYTDISVHYFIQYHLHLQLQEAAGYARSKNICLKGDIPIGIFRHSVDAWMYPNLFNMEMQAGAPPDDFAVDGQNWGFPTYKWEEMEKDGFQWWVKRLTQMAEYFDAYRIDHVLGFFRIWQIPMNAVTGLMGYFNPAIPIHIDEIRSRGIHFDYDRYCKPYIREHFLGDKFGEYTDYVKSEFLEPQDHGVWVLKEHVDTQRKAANLLAPTETMSMADRARNEKIKRGLWALHAEILLIEVPGSNKTEFHPRVRMNTGCKSFEELDGHSKSQLYELYLDYFFSRQEEFWAEKARVKLPAIKNATNMLICAEDLGMVPACVPGVMKKLDMVRLAIQRMPPDTTQSFWHPQDTPYLCVASPSGHDMSSIRGWWEEDRAVTQKFWEEILGHHGSAPSMCEPFVVYEVVNQHLWAPCILAIFPIQDIVGMNGNLRRNPPQVEQINVPANPEHYWRYRFHMNMEDLIEETSFNNSFKKMIMDAGRRSAYGTHTQ